MIVHNHIKKQAGYQQRWEERKKRPVLTSEQQTVTGGGWTLLLGDPEKTREMLGADKD